MEKLQKNVLTAAGRYMHGIRISASGDSGKLSRPVTSRYTPQLGI